jgi:allene oxide cyclase
MDHAIVNHFKQGVWVMGQKPQVLSSLGIKSRLSLAVVMFAFAGWVAIGAPGIANAAKSSAAKHTSGGGATTIHVIEHAVTDTVIHSGGGADVTGNSLTFHNKVYNPANVKVVGSDQGYCVRIAPAEGSWECAWTTFLKGGQITVQGPYYDKKNSVLAITGGTGAYRNARGDMNLNSRKGGTEYDFIFHLS